MLTNDWIDNRNLTMLIDFYELTMSHGYFQNGIGDKEVYFDMFFRDVPDDGGFAITSGLEQLIDYLNNIKFSDSDIDFLKSKKIFSPEFLDYLKYFKFCCDVWAIPEGTPVFPNEPILVVKGPAIQAQLIETIILLTINFQSLITTKSNRIVRAADGRTIIEFGSRRAQAYDAAVLGARAAYIGGCIGSSCTMSDLQFGIPCSGTMGHSWIQLFDTELEAFRTYAQTYPDNCILLVDTYNTLKSGVPNAIKIFNEVLAPKGIRPKAIRIDSGDITYLSKKARVMLDSAGYPDCLIIASNSLDEYIIRDLLLQGAKVDSFGVGERLITSKSEPVFGGVYKLVGVENSGEIIPKIKLSDNPSKITIPGFKQVHRLFSKETNKAIADVITLFDETIDDSQPYELFHPSYTWKRKVVTDFYSKKLLEKIFDRGTCIYNKPSLDEIRTYCKLQLDTLWDEILRFDNPHEYYVDLSQNLWDIKNNLLKGSGGRGK